eukprot:g13472.t1
MREGGASHGASVALVRRSGHAKACERLLTSKQRLETELQMLHCFRAWAQSWERGQRSRRTPGAARGLALREGRLLGQIFGLWRIASTGEKAGLALRSLWSIEAQRGFGALQRKLSARHEALNTAFCALQGHRALGQLWRSWACRVHAKRRAQDRLYFGCQKKSCLVTLPLCFKHWAWQLRRQKAARMLVQRAWRFDVRLLDNVYVAWRRFAQLRAEAAPSTEGRIMCGLFTSSLDQTAPRLQSLILRTWHQRCLRRRVMHSFQRQHRERHGRQGDGEKK